MPETRELTLAEAVREAMAEEMRRDARVFICGEDIAEAGTVFKVLAGLVAGVGRGRLLDTPIFQSGFNGPGVVQAVAGTGPPVGFLVRSVLTAVLHSIASHG